MLWARVHTAYLRHPKLRAVGPEARGLHLGAVLFSAEHETDGWLAAGDLRGADPDLAPQRIGQALKRLIGGGLFVPVPRELGDPWQAFPDVQPIDGRSSDELEKRVLGLWSEVGSVMGSDRGSVRWSVIPRLPEISGVLLHSFLTYQTASVDAERDREGSRERVRRHRLRQRNGVTGENSNGVTGGERLFDVTPPRAEQSRQDLVTTDNGSTSRETAALPDGTDPEPAGLVLGRLVRLAARGDDNSAAIIRAEAAGLPEAAHVRALESLMGRVPRPANPAGYTVNTLRSLRRELDLAARPRIEREPEL